MSVLKPLIAAVTLAALCFTTNSAWAWRDSPEISQRAGWPGQIVVLWTRTTPAPNDPIVASLERALQQRLEDIVISVAPDTPQNVRPAPERVCRQKGCRTVSVAATLMHQDDGCAVVAVVTGAGPSQGAVVPWGGVIDISDDSVAFRAPPEELVTVHDFVPCTRLLEHLDDDTLRETIRAVIVLDTAK